MSGQHSTEIAVIGAGAVGLSVALRLAAEGREVTLVAPEDNGDGASCGNAGVIADYAVLPVGTPAVLKNLPSLLLDRNSPLAIRHAALPALMPWLLRFARQSLPGPARRNARAIAGLLAHAAPDWKSLAAEVGAREFLRQRGTLYFYETAREFARAPGELDWQRSLGVNVELIGSDALGQLEPGLPAGVAAGAAFFPDTITTSDPGAILRRLDAAVSAAGVARITGHATGLQRVSPGVLVSGTGFALRARKAVLAAGAWSRALAAQAGDRVPLDTERGYHLEFDMQTPPLSRPATPVSRGFYFCPMQGRLRVAGTVELGGLKAPPSPHRIRHLLRGARAIFPDLPEPSREWMGFRPSLPDSLPVIGPSRAGDEVIHAYGHGHLGLTLAPVTARMVADLVAGRDPGPELAPCLPQRF